MEQKVASQEEETSDKVKLVFVGSPLLDITAKCDKKTLKRFGLKRDDAIKATEKHDDLFHDLFKDSKSELSSGGSAQNSARIAKWILGNYAYVSFVGCTGKDTFERWLRESLTSDGVTPLYVRNPDMKTGICACLVVGENERSMITRHEAAASLRAEHLSITRIQRHVSEADYIFVEGYFVGHSPDVVLALADKCLPTQTFSLSLSAEYICRDYTDILLKVLPRVDVLVGNEAEVIAFAEAMGPVPPLQSITVEEAIKDIRQRQQQPSSSFSKIIIVTRGALPVIVDDGTKDLKIFEVPSDVTMVDSIGCGDALAGAFLSSYALTKDLELSINTGIRAATEIGQVKGCNLPAIKIFEPKIVVKNLFEEHDELHS